jgi:DNA (cytosine-5)-methyltransferase 1
VSIVSIRKDIDLMMFRFKDGFPLDIRLKDVLEDEVDEKFYLKETADYFVKHSFDSESKGNGFRFDHHVKDKADVAKTVTTRAGGRMDDNFVIDIESESSTFKFDSTNPQVRQIANLMPSKTRENPNQGRLYDKEGLSPTLGAMQGGNRQPFIVVDDESVKVREATKQGYADLKRNGQGIIEPEANALRIRKLTPKECFRLMGFDDADFEKAEAVNSNTQLYKQAGNSIVVQVIEHIFKALTECGAFRN